MRDMDSARLRVVCYVRVSTREQAEKGYSVSEQQERLKAYCLAKDWVVAQVITDPGFSGAKLERPGMQQLISLVQAKKCDAVLVWKLDRLQPLKEIHVQADKVLAEGQQAEEPSWESNKYGAGEVQNKQKRREEKTVEQDAAYETDDGQNQPAEQRTQDTDDSSEESEPPVFEIVPDEKKENMRRFEAILKRLIAEVVEEQNEKLEKVLCEMIREEAANLFELYQSALEEAAAEREMQKKTWLRTFLEKCFGKR